MNNIQEALNFYGLKYPVKNKRVIKKTFQKLSMKYHPDKGGNENDFKLLLKYRDILEKNFNFISEKGNKINDFWESKKDILFLKGKEQVENSVNIFFKIYLEGLCYKAILFFLVIVYFSNDFLEQINMTTIGIPFITIIGIGVKQSGAKAVKSASIFAGLSIYMLGVEHFNMTLSGIDGSARSIVFYSLFVIPPAIYFIKEYKVQILNFIGIVLQKLFIIFVVGGTILALLGSLGLLDNFL